IGPAYLHTHYKTPLYLGASKRLSLGHFEKKLIPLDVPESLTQEEKAVEKVCQHLATLIFAEILKSPEQWITFDDYFSREKSPT
ncbi:MAG: hypothetical protein HQL32_12220, partial [Planctomycetes bacterium]|nr:hypothetical protein [Planctomycetota bacterium]